MNAYTRPGISSDRGMALTYMAVTMTALLLFTGLAVDGGRGYVVKAQLTKAVDGAALAAARSLNSGDPRGEAVRVFKANFPPGYFGTVTSPDPTAAADFFSEHYDAATGVNFVNVAATAVLPTTFMKLGSFQEMTVHSSGEASRRLVDLSLVLDVSGSIGARWPAVRDASRDFIGNFDQLHDRMALVTYSYGAKVIDQINSARGYDKVDLAADVPATLPGGVTNMAEGLYRGWDELRTVPAGSQSGLRIIVLFTDGSANTVSGNYDSTVAKGVFVSDFPQRSPDPDGITTNAPALQGLYQTETGARSPSVSFSTTGSTGYLSLSTIASVPWLPATSLHDHHRSSGIPTTFPLQVGTLKVDGSWQNAVRGLSNISAGKYPAHAGNIRKAATNLTEIIANAARSDTSGDYKVRIYTIGMGNLVQMQLGTRPETAESVLMRLANDKRSPDYNSTQLEGKYYFARTEADLSSVYQQLMNQIIRLSK